MNHKVEGHIPYPIRAPIRYVGLFESLRFLPPGTKTSCIGKVIVIVPNRGMDRMSFKCT